jgi:hypothetical protein
MFDILRSDLIESVQLDAAQIITGFGKGTPRLRIYNDLG